MFGAKRILALTALFLTVGGGSLIYAQVKTGEPAPDFMAADIKGTTHSLSDFKGKYVILEWFNYDCPFVKKHYGSGNMQALQKEYTDKGSVWLAIDSSAEGQQGYYTPQEAMKLSEERNSAATAIFLDPSGEIGKLYGAKTTPHMFIINPEGVLIYQGAIDDISSADAADIAGSVNYVKAAMDEASAGKPVTNSNTKSYGCSVKY